VRLETCMRLILLAIGYCNLQYYKCMDQWLIKTKKKMKEIKYCECQRIINKKIVWLTLIIGYIIINGYFL